MPININFLITFLKKLDPQVFVPLKNQVGKTGEIHFSDLSYSIFFKITPATILIQDYIENPDMIVSGNTINLISLACSRDSKISAAVFMKKNICVSGEISLLTALYQAMQQIEIDWEGHLAKISGDMAAFHIGKTIKNVNQWIKTRAQTRIQDLTLFLQEENKALPTQYELQDFYDQVDNLTEATERLEQRINEKMHDRI